MISVRMASDVSGCVVGVLTMLLNASAVVAILKTHPNTPSIILMTTVCISDFLVGLSGTCCASRRIATDIPVIDLIGNQTQIVNDISVGYVYSCLACLFMSQVSVIGSVLSILAIAVDRFIAVVYPLRHPSIVVKNKVKIYIACSWTVILMICSYTFWSPLAPNYYLTQCQALTWVDGRYFLSIFLSTTLSSILVTTVLYIYIVCIAIKQRKKIDAEQRQMRNIRHSPVSTIQMDNSSTGQAFQPEISGERSHRQQWRITKLLIAVIGVFYLCWIPYFFMTIYLKVAREKLSDITDAENKAYSAAKIVSVINSLINPCLCMYKDRKLWQYLNKRCGK